MTAISKLLDGVRQWDPQAQPDLAKHLFNAIDSESSNLAKSAENRKTGRISNSSEDQATMPELASSQFQDEIGRRSDDWLLAFWDSLSDEPELQAVVAEIVEGSVKPREIAAALGIGVEELRARRRKLSRRMSQYRQVSVTVAPQKGVRNDRE